MIKTDASAAQVAAAILWDRFTDEERSIVRFGMVPLWAASEYPTISARNLSLALMDCAKRNGGMGA